MTPSSRAIVPAPRTDRRGLLWRAALFLALFAIAQTLYSQADEVERFVINQTVQTSAWLIDQLDPDAQVQANGPRLQAPGGGLNVLNGCEGTDVIFLIASAMLVAPLPWTRRVLGLLIGAALTFALNQARVLALFYAFRGDRALFDMLHGVVAPILLILSVAGFFILWLNLPYRQPQPDT